MDDDLADCKAALLGVEIRKEERINRYSILLPSGPWWVYGKDKTSCLENYLKEMERRDAAGYRKVGR